MKKTILTSLKILFSGLIIWFLVHRASLDFSLLLNLFAYPLQLSITLLLYLITILLSTKRWQKLNHAQGIHLSYFRTLLPTYLGVAFNNLLPGGIGGDFFRFYFLHKQVIASKSAIMLAIFVDRLTGLLGIVIIVAFFAFFYLSQTFQIPFIFYFLLTSLIILFSLFIFYAFRSYFPKLNFSDKKYPGLTSFLAACQLFRKNKLIILESLAISTLIQLLIAITCLLIAKMMSFPEMPFFHYVSAIAITQLVNLIPIAPGGFGVGEMAFAQVFMYLNPGQIATYATIFLAYRVLGILFYLPGLGIFIFDRHLLNAQTKGEETN